MVFREGYEIIGEDAVRYKSIMDRNGDIHKIRQTDPIVCGPDRDGFVIVRIHNGTQICQNLFDYPCNFFRNQRAINFLNGPHGRKKRQATIESNLSWKENGF